MFFSKEFLQEEGGETIEDKITGKSRWSMHCRRVFKHEGKFYATTYSVGLTEHQDEQPYEHESDEIDCPEVFPVSKTVVVYE